MALADYQQLVNDLVADQDAALSPEVRERAIEQARLRYSADCERELVADVVWPVAGSHAPLPTEWTEGAYVRHAEFPVGALPPVLIELAVYQAPQGQSLMAAEPLAAGSVVRVTFAAAHLLQGGADAADTLPLAHRRAVAEYAAYLLCQQLATRYSAERETSLGADMARTESRARAYAARAREYRDAYYAGTGQANPFAAAAQGGTLSGAASVGSWPRRNPRFGLVQRGGL